MIIPLFHVFIIYLIEKFNIKLIEPKYEAIRICNYLSLLSSCKISGCRCLSYFKRSGEGAYIALGVAMLY